MKTKGDIRVASDDVRFGLEADISALVIAVRFTPESRHADWLAACPLSAKSGHSYRRRPFNQRSIKVVVEG